jgi:hypothetical protein
MTTIYKSKEDALNRGIFYSGKKDLLIKDLRKVDGKVYQFGSPIDSELYELENKDGITVTLGIEFAGENRFCLWLITPEGFAVRT